MSLPKEELKNRLREALYLRNMKPIELSEKTGIPKSAISQYMSGYAKPKSDRVYLMSKALSVPEAWLIGYDVDYMVDGMLIETMARQDVQLSNLSARMKHYALLMNELPKEKQEHVMNLIDMLSNKEEKQGN